MLRQEGITSTINLSKLFSSSVEEKWINYILPYFDYTKDSKSSIEVIEKINSIANKYNSSLYSKTFLEMMLNKVVDSRFKDR